MSKFGQDLLVITASNGKNLELANRFVEMSRKRDLNTDLIDLTSFELPLFTPRVDPSNFLDIINDIKRRFHKAPKWIICAPEYNGSIPPSLTNTIAWLSTQDSDFRSLFNSKPIAIATFSGGGGMELLLSLRIQLTHLGADVIGRQLLSNHNKPPKDETINDLLDRLVNFNSK